MIADMFIDVGLLQRPCGLGFSADEPTRPGVGFKLYLGHLLLYFYEGRIVGFCDNRRRGNRWCVLEQVDDATLNHFLRTISPSTVPIEEFERRVRELVRELFYPTVSPSASVSPSMPRKTAVPRRLIRRKSTTKEVRV